MSHRFGFAPRLRIVLILSGIFLSMGDLAMARSDALDPMAVEHVVEARSESLARCRELGIELPSDFVAWIDSGKDKCPICRKMIITSKKKDDEANEGGDDEDEALIVKNTGAIKRGNRE